MRDIYRKACLLVAWIGEEDNASGSAIELIEELSQYGRAGSGTELESELRDNPAYLGTGYWLALRDFMERPYWYQLWIIQEIIMGESSMVVRSRTCSISWKSFCARIGVLQEHLCC